MDLLAILHLSSSNSRPTALLNGEKGDLSILITVLLYVVLGRGMLSIAYHGLPIVTTFYYYVSCTKIQ